MAQTETEPRDDELPQTMEAPDERPEQPEQQPDEPAAQDVQGDETKPPRPAAGTLVPPEEMACRAELTKLGVAFTTAPPIADEGGCGTPFPLIVTGLADGITLEPEATVNCRTALATALYIRDEVAPQARSNLGVKLKGVRHASAYVCRPRHDGSKLSEHALANAIDLSAFLLEGGREVAVQGYGPGEDGERRFMRRIRGAACGPFKTVLGPGSDGDHADHLHLDMAERRNDGTWCR